VTAIASPLGFEVSVLDDRTDCASVERFPLAHKRLIGEIEDELRRYPIDAQTYLRTQDRKDSRRIHRLQEQDVAR